MSGEVMDEDALSTTARLVRIETKFDLLMQQVMPQQADHETRIRQLERTVWTASGIATALGGAIGALVSFLMGGGA
ncbi:hypothetical protein ACU61A_15675 [Pseudonocardia sichuanensis]